MPSKRWRAAVRGRRHKRRRARRRRRARGGSAPEVDDADFITAILRALTMNVARPKPPVDPYARGSVVPPMKTAQKVSAEHAEYGMGKSLATGPTTPTNGAIPTASSGPPSRSGAAVRTSVGDAQLRVRSYH